MMNFFTDLEVDPGTLPFRGLYLVVGSFINVLSA